MEYSAQPDFHAVAEAYPELKAVTLYDNLMKELALTENDVPQNLFACFSQQKIIC